MANPIKPVIPAQAGIQAAGAVSRHWWCPADVAITPLLTAPVPGASFDRKSTAPAPPFEVSPCSRHPNCARHQPAPGTGAPSLWQIPSNPSFRRRRESKPLAPFLVIGGVRRMWRLLLCSQPPSRGRPSTGRALPLLLPLRCPLARATQTALGTNPPPGRGLRACGTRACTDHFCSWSCSTDTVATLRPSGPPA